MTPHGHTTIKNPTGEWSPALPMDRSRRFVLAVTLLAGLFMTTVGVAALVAPSWFADTAGFPTHPLRPRRRRLPTRHRDHLAARPDLA
jgi:hypothetical protein